MTSTIPDSTELPASAYQRLLEAIREGQYRPGDRIRESDAAAMLGLSRTPIREALRQLEADGIVEHKPRVGAVVRSLSQQEIVELYEMRVVLEQTAARLAARHASNAELAELSDLNDAMLAAREEPQAAAALNANFHRTLHLAARNRFLLESLRALNNALMLLGPTTLEEGQRIETAHAQHGEILAALGAHDADAASAAMAAHIEASLRIRLKALRA